MIAPELISHLRDLSASISMRNSPNATLDASEWLLYLAVHVDEARLADGQRLNDATDFIAWLRELGEAASVPKNFAPQLFFKVVDPPKEAA